MTDTITWVKVAFAGICGILSYIFGGMDAMLKILIAMMVTDYITGISAAIYQKTLCSRTGCNGILRKAGILCVVACGHMLGVAMGVSEIRSAVIGFYIANEAISITENAAELGVPMPKRLIDVLEKINKDD